jgi:5-methylthioadenosine/S-adenosylhomocysteine deaminase
VGLRIVLLRAFYDVPGPAGRERFLEPPRVARQRIEELSSEIAGREEVSVAAAPHSLHGASREAFAQAKEWADGRGAVLHVHLAEQRDDVAFARERWGAPPLEALASMGVVDDRLAVVHGCWLEGGEIAQLAAAGASLVYNPGSNMALGDGVTDVEALVDAGVNVALGADGACANNQLDVFREMRLTEHLQRVTKHRMGVLTASRGAGVAWKMATRNGARARGLGPQDGTLEPGGVADLLALDPDDPSLQPLDLDAEDAGEILMAQLAFSAAPRGAVTDVLVGGRPIVRERRLALVSEREVAAAVRR